MNKSPDSSLPDHHYDKDFDEAFNNLLIPIELILKKTKYDHYHQYDLLKELDSYLNHLKSSSNDDSSMFVEAALMLQNVMLIYNKKVDDVVNDTMKLISKFQSYRVNINGTGDDTKKNAVDGNKKKKIEKKVKCYSSFEPIEIEVCSSLKDFDCKKINLSTLPPLQKTVLNTNIKVINKYNKALPHINVGNGENMGKKYDYKMNFPLNCALAVSDEIDCHTNVDLRVTNLNILPIDLMDIDVPINEGYDTVQSSLDPVVFNQIIIPVMDEVRAANAMEPMPADNIMDVDQIPEVVVDKSWDRVVNAQDNIYSDKPIVQKRKVKKKERNNTFWIPKYTFEGIGITKLELNLSMSVDMGSRIDPTFIKHIRAAKKIQKSNIFKIRMQLKKKQINNGEPEPIMFNHEMYADNDYDDLCGMPEIEPLLEGQVRDNYETYLKMEKNMRHHDHNQMEIVDEHLAMRKRVDAWHDKLYPILKEEENRTEFDIHAYGTEILNAFSCIGEEKLFKELIQDKDIRDISRYFLSVLMMANTYNLSITNSDGELCIKLLKRNRHHEELQENIGNQIVPNQE